MTIYTDLVRLNGKTCKTLQTLVVLNTIFLSLRWQIRQMNSSNAFKIHMMKPLMCFLKYNYLSYSFNLRRSYQATLCANCSRLMGWFTVAENGLESPKFRLA